MAATAVPAAPAVDPAVPAAEEESVVTPFKVKGKQDYDRLIKEFGTQRIDDQLLRRFQRVTGRRPHPLLRRALFFSHRDFDRILTCYEKGQPFFLYTGRGPSSSSMHIGHTIPFDFTKWLQEVFDVPLIIMLTDDEKFLYNEKLTINESTRLTTETLKDIAAFGFDPKKTFVFSDFRYMGGHFYQNSVEFARLVTFNQVRGTFGFDASTNIGFINFPAIQNTAAFASSFPELFGDDPSPTAPRNAKTAAIQCLIPCGIDQDPYFRLLRHNSHRMSLPSPPPALIHAKFLTALQGAEGKMSASEPNSAIFMSDSPKQIKDKINKHAFSGGQATLEEQREKGGDPDVDVAFQMLVYFLDDDDELEHARTDYRSGQLLTGELKKRAIAILQAYVGEYQARRAAVTDADVDLLTKPRLMEFGGNPNPGFLHPVDGETEPPAEQTGEQFPSVNAESNDKHAAHAERPGLGRRRTYGVTGLQQFERQVSELLYPTRTNA